MYDAIVVGARCAGSPTAMLLARKGYRVLLVDKSTFPSDIMSTHYIHLPGVARLAQWGLLDQLWAAGTPRIDKVTIFVDGQPFSPPRLDPDAPPNCCPRRKLLDKVLVDAAVAAGVELREEFSVKELIYDGDAVAGIRGAAKGGVTVEERARIVIGADGLHSLVARSVKPAEYDTVPTLTFGYYSYFSGVDMDGAELRPSDDGGILAFPTNDGMTCIAIGGPEAGFQEFRKDIDGSFFRALDAAQDLGERVRAGKREERYMGTNDQPNYFRTPYGPGWALVGDAGYHRDFITGLGITDAFRDAELLADAIDAGFSGRQPLQVAMAAYERRRNELAKPLYEVTLSMARGEAQPDIFLQFGLAIQSNMPVPVS